MKKTLIITASAHIMILLMLVIVPSCQKKPKIIKPDIPINITEDIAPQEEPKNEEPKKEEPKPTPKKEEPKKEEPKKEEPKKEEPKKEEPKPKPTPKKEEPKPTPKPKKKIVKKKKIIKKPEKSLKEKIEEKLKNAEKKPTKKTTEKTSTKKSAVKTTDLKAKNFPFKWYLDVVQHKVKTNWQEPGKVPGLSSTVSATVSFTIDKQGNVSNIKINKSSSFPALDQSALKGVKNAKPFPPLPGNYKKDTLDIIIKFNLSA